MKTIATTLLSVGLGLMLTACPSNDDKKPGAQPTPSATSSAAPQPSSAASTGAAASGAAPAGSSATAKAPSPGTAQTFRGNYDAKAADLTLPKDVKWKGDDVGQDGIGEGSLEITIDADGVLRGTGKGALGEVFLSGTSKEQIVSGWMLRKTAGDLGFSGSFYATVEGKELKGILRASRGNAGALREASFTLKRAE